MTVLTATDEKPRKIFENDRLMLLLLSFLSLYIEIMLIRHLSSEIRIFAYFKNLALIGAFIGLGFGYLYRPKLSMSVTAICIAVLAAASHPVSGFSKISDYLNIGGFNVWAIPDFNIASLILGLILLTIVFFTVILSLVPIGQRLGEIFDRSENRILDYSINIFGSLLGIWAFAGLSFAMLSPVWWYLISMAIMFALWRWDAKQMVILACLAAVITVSLTYKVNTFGGVEKWSPYQKIALRKEKFNYIIGEQQKHIDFYRLMTNSTIYMYLLDLSDKLRADHPGIFRPELNPYYYYDLPYLFPKKLDDVLVLGAGAGNDVAGALRAGAKSVTAVEIDPIIIRAGKRFHPEKPYSSPKVTIINNDARNYLRETDKKYDLIVLGLLDSHTLTSSFSNTNLDSYMYTLQSVGDMKRHLKDDGVLALSFQIIRPWIGSKIYSMIETQFGKAPVLLPYDVKDTVVRGTGGTYFLVSQKDGLVESVVKSHEVLAALAKSGEAIPEYYKANPAEIQTDDWPYLYVKERAIPPLHLFVSFTLIAIFLVIYLYSFGKPKASDLHFAALGAGFLLLEVSVITRFALFWGATWIVSSIVISLILVAILIANGVFIWRGKNLPYGAIYAVLAVALIAVYMTPLESNWVILLYLAPFTVIGYLFAQSFNSAELGSRALAFNLFGALLGGFSESFSFMSGLSNLILVALGFYLLSYVFVLKRA